MESTTPPQTFRNRHAPRWYPPIETWSVWWISFQHSFLLIDLNIGIISKDVEKRNHTAPLLQLLWTCLFSSFFLNKVGSSFRDKLKRQIFQENLFEFAWRYVYGIFCHALSISIWTCFFYQLFFVRVSLFIQLCLVTTRDRYQRESGPQLLTSCLWNLFVLIL